MRGLTAFTITLLIYILLAWLYFTQFAQIKPLKPKVNNHRIKIDIRNIPDSIAPKSQPKSVAKPKPIPQVIPTPIIKKPVEKKTLKKKVVKKKIKKKKIVKKKPKEKIQKKKIKKKKVVKKKKKIIKKKTVKKKRKMIKHKKSTKKIVNRHVKEIPYIPVEDMLYIPDPFLTTPTEVESFPEPIVRQPKRESSNDLVSFLRSPSPSAPVSQHFPSRKIQKLYGASFHRFTATQKKFLKNNLESIQRITQNILTRRGYPAGASRMGEEGTNIVEFYLHPNGDISNLHLKQRMGFRELDENTITLIRVAYKDYPYPVTTTKIIFNVTYSIYGY